MTISDQQYPLGKSVKIDHDGVRVNAGMMSYMTMIQDDIKSPQHVKQVRISVSFCVPLTVVGNVVTIDRRELASASFSRSRNGDLID